MTQAELPVVRVARWPSERPLYVLVLLAALGIWAMLAISLIGIVYAALLGVVFFVAHLAFITHLRGNAVRLGPDQMPELYGRVVELSARIGLPRTPEAYVVQAGGALNALATRFLRANVIVLFSDLLEACGNNDEARDFIVAHELGHLHAGHLRWRWLLIPGLAFPFLGTAWSRACEYTCDRYGLSASRDASRALDGLCVLAAGGKHGPSVNRRALVAQRADLNTPWMRIGVWLSTHPPIADRLAVLDPSLGPRISSLAAGLGGLVVIALAILVPAALGLGALHKAWPAIRAAMEKQRSAATSVVPVVPGDDPRVYVQTTVLSLADAAEQFRAANGHPPAHRLELYEYWQTLHPVESQPLDPWSQQPFFYQSDGTDYVILSAGPDGVRSEDDLYYSSREQR